MKPNSGMLKRDSKNRSSSKAGDAFGYYESHIDAQKEDKRRVANFVCKNLVLEGDSIALDAGTSSTKVAECLFKSHRRKNLTILTHNMDVFNRFYSGNPGQNIQLILTGGEYSTSYKALFGYQTETAYNEFYPRLVILAISGIICTDKALFKNGLYCHATVERPIKGLLFSRPSARRVVLADWKKIGRADSYLFGKMENIGTGISEKIVIVTTIPPPDTDQSTVDQFNNIIKNLINIRKIEVICLDHSGNELKNYGGI